MAPGFKVEVIPWFVDGEDEDGAVVFFFVVIVDDLGEEAFI